ncbi:hypothetical protein BD780_004236 [Clostridium tetanomorphum]|uniref:hypothetical protein n=1 Tax=Clostridium tetanomorphum TaxID=1553 RepID=UPI00044AD793|nr:hypothetical protein [Clostridium tetanomorphum]KAJ50129.1 hypothetical protein CTM_19839 [Clostridium tetanomorphum DSM 665]MBP1862874.1 hypothetical protein [Clostridium tetanomorphum]NRS87011.1 hypothetical protein [Clostridium tetanomorphum]SQC00184.1 Predicted membrane protein [Clostridium tetanomorphum]
MKKCRILLIISIIICILGMNDSKGVILNSISVNTDNVVDSKEKNNKDIIKLKSVDNIDLSEIQYFISEQTRDSRLEEAIAKVYNLQKGKDKFRYYFNRVQLNDNIEPETFVYLVGPQFCGTGGCSAAIFKCENGEYKLLSKVTLVNNPIIITNNFTNGYRDIIMYVSGGGAKEAYSIIKFDGTSYPQNPSLQPKVSPGTKLEGPAIIADDITKNVGIEF